MTHMTAGVSALFLAGCSLTTDRPLEVATGDPRSPTVAVHTVQAGMCQITDVTLGRDGDAWTLAGALKCHGERMPPPGGHAVQVRAIDAAGTAVFWRLAAANAMPASARDRTGTRATFSLEVPPPGTYDHLEVTVASLRARPTGVITAVEPAAR
jgi:hypothetical protein